MNIEGVKIRKMSTQMHLSRNTVRRIIRGKNVTKSCRRRSNAIDVTEDKLLHLYKKCKGWKERMHEELTASGIEIGYSTLTRMIRQLGIGRKIEGRCGRVDDTPGEEMQHDTSTYIVTLGVSKVKLVASLLYMRYSKKRYLTFYARFDRFAMKCFLDEALKHFGYSAKICVIDNTNLAVLSGTGKNAIITPEMEQFFDRYGSKFIAHEINHSNRKAGEERSFWTVTTNFLPGRKFIDLEDLNKQAFEWATVIMDNRAQTKKKIIPKVAFEEEKQYLNKIPSYLPRPYRVSDRVIDQYGYISFIGNYYWIPGASRHPVKVLEYSDSIKIFHDRNELIEHKLLPYNVRNKRVMPENVSDIDYAPKSQKKPSKEMENELLSLGGDVPAYIDFIKKQKGIRIHIFIRDIYKLSKRRNIEIFHKTITRSLQYRIVKTKTIESIFLTYLNSENIETFIDCDFDNEYTSRDTFLEGEHSKKPNIEIYDEILYSED